MTNGLTRPIIGLEFRTQREVFDIMCARMATAADALSRATDEEGLARVIREAAWDELAIDLGSTHDFSAAHLIARAIIDHIKGDKQ